MGILDNALFGAPKASGETGEEVVTAREFDVTQYGKKMAVLIGVLAPAIVGGLKVLWGKDVTPAMVVAALGVTGIAILSASLVMAADMISRAIVTRAEHPKSTPAAGGASGGDPGDGTSKLEPGEEVKVTTKERRLSRG